MHLRLGCFALACFATIAPAQSPPQQTSPPPRPRIAWASIPQPPVPADPLELVTGGIQPVQDPQQRLAVVNLLSAARLTSNLRGHPYDMKISLTTTGSSPTDGTWQLEESSPGRGVVRWTAQGPNYSSVNLYKDGMLYSNQASTSVPIRLAEARAAVFLPPAMLGPRAALRTTNAELNGIQVTCALVTHMPDAKLSNGGRDWDEAEYCVDPKAGVLMTYSPVPGLYIAYDYSSAIHFHDKIVPDKFVITQAGQTVIEAHVDSVSDAANANASFFDPSSLTLLGIGDPMALPSSARLMDGPPNDGTPTVNGIVIVHGMVSSDGHLSETEVLASTNPALNQVALDRAAKMHHFDGGQEPQPGATPQPHELFITLQMMIPVHKDAQ